MSGKDLGLAIERGVVAVLADQHVGREHPRIGTMQYPETLPLEDREVVQTFDDGPLPHNSNQVLDILASECVKAEYYRRIRLPL